MSVYDINPDEGDYRDTPKLDALLAPDEVTAAREQRAQREMAEEVRTLIWCALRTQARKLAETPDGRDDAERCADLARMVRTLADPVPLAAVLGLT